MMTRLELLTIWLLIALADALAWAVIIKTIFGAWG